MSSIMTTPTPVADIISPPPGASESARSPIVSALIFMVLGAVIASLGFGGVLYSLSRSGRLSMSRSARAKPAPSTASITHLIVLDPLLVNLTGDSGSSYLRLSLDLQVADEPGKKDSAQKNDKGGDIIAAVRDTVLTELGRQTSDSLLAPDGKDHLKLALKKALEEHNPDLKVKELYFTDFLVQR
jgi:flagellar FliL protein